MKLSVIQIFYRHPKSWKLLNQMQVQLIFIQKKYSSTHVVRVRIIQKITQIKQFLKRDWIIIENIARINMWYYMLKQIN